MGLHENSGKDWTPGKRVVAQWARHVCKLQKNIRACTGRDKPSLSLILKAEDVSKFLTVSDGDGFLVAGLRIRLFGLDAPEIDQSCLDEMGKSWPCGEKARWRLFEILSGNEIEVRVIDVDCYGRLLAVCYINDDDIGAIMVREGFAVCFGSKRYKKDEDEAIKQRRGMWSGAYETPQSWRKTHPLKKNPSKNGKTHVQSRLEKRNSRAGKWKELEKGFELLLQRARALSAPSNMHGKTE
jgi:endonuclease YncB( thermonuclease family)